MAITQALLTYDWYGYPGAGDPRRHTPHVLAVVHQTATAPRDGQAMALRNQRNTATQPRNTATYYIDPDGDAVHAVDGTHYASWCSGTLNRPATGNPAVATIVRHHAAGMNPNECVWEQLECVGNGAEPWTEAQFETAAGLIAARAALCGLPITRQTVLPHRDLDTVNRPSDPWPAATREARMGRLIARAQAISGGDADMPGLALRLVATTTQTAWLTAFGTAKVKGPGHSAIRVHDRRYLGVADGLGLGLVQKAALLAPLDTIPGDRTNGYVTNIGSPSEQHFVLASDVTFTPTAPPLPPDTSPYTQAQLDAAVAAARKAEHAAVDAAWNTWLATHPT